jgi:signal transduction histidine kinase
MRFISNAICNRLPLRQLVVFCCLLFLFFKGAQAAGDCVEGAEQLSEQVELLAAETLKQVENAWVPAKAAQDKACQIDLLLVRARAQRYLGELSAAERSLLEAKAMAVGDGFRTRRSRITARLGQIAENLGKMEESIGLLTQAVELAGEDAEPRAYALNLLGHAYQTNDNPDAAERSFEIALNLYKKLGKSRQAASVLLNMALLARARKDLGRARSFAEEALASARKEGSKRGMAGALQLLGNLAIDEQRFDAGIATHRQALQIWLDLGDAYGVARARTSLARGLSLAAAQLDGVASSRLQNEAIELLGLAHSYNSEAHTLPSLLAGYRLLADLHAKRGAYQSAYQAALDYSDLRQRVFNDESRARMDALNAQFDLRQAEAARELAERNAAISAQTSATRGRMLALVSTLLLVTFAGLVLYWQMKRLRDRDNRAREVAENQLSTALNSAPTGMVVVDADECIEKINRAAVDLLALQPADIKSWVGRPISQLREQLVVTDNQGNPLPLQMLPLRVALIEGRAAEHVEVTIKTANGPKPVLLSAAAVRDGSGKTVSAVCAISDITALRAAERERLNLRVRVSEAEKNESIQLMVSSLAHEFSNQLQAAQGHVDLAAAGHPLDLEELSSLLERSTDLVSRLQMLAGFSLSHPQVIRVSELLQKVVRKVEARYGDAQVKLELDQDDLFVQVDVDLMQHALYELAANASEATPGLPVYLSARAISEAGEPRGEALLKPERGHGYIEIAVTDHGPGMAESELKRAFDPFVSSKSKSRGLGLTLVRGIVRAHKAGLHVASAPSEGTQVSIVLPQMRSAA